MFVYLCLLCTEYIWEFPAGRPKSGNILRSNLFKSLHPEKYPDPVPGQKLECPLCGYAPHQDEIHAFFLEIDTLHPQELIVFGRSPFIKDVDVSALIERYPSLGFNGFGQHYPVDYLFFYDGYWNHHPDTEVFIPHWFDAKHPGTRYAPRPFDRPLTNEIFQEDIICLGHKYFTTSVALNWAILEGFETVYLVGVDHVETDKTFIHHDGSPCESMLTPEAHAAFKQYVYNCLPHINIYQCNPAVADDWNLPYKDLSSLYAS